MTKDLPRAFALYRQACEANDHEACGRLGHLYLHGRGTEKNISEAVRLFERSCEDGDGYGCAALATCYRDGTGVLQDIARADALDTKACAAHYTNACPAGSAVKNEAAPQ